MTLYLDNTDFSTYVKKRGYSVSYKRILGPNSFTTLDGTYHEDVIAKKAIVDVPLNPLTAANLATLTDAVYKATSATFYDSETGVNVTKSVTASLSTASVIMTKGTTQYWGEELVLTLEEK